MATTTNLAIPYVAGTDLVSGWPAADQAQMTVVDGIIPAFAGAVLQPGVEAATDGTVSNPAVSGAGLVSATATLGGFAWGLLGTALVRNSIPTGAISAAPGSLPAASKFAIVGIDLVIGQFGAAGSIALSTKGTDQTTQALALSNPPATASGHLRLMDVVILNTAGTYSLSTSRDRRLWARGAESFTFSASAALTAGTELSTCSSRIECSGAPMTLTMNSHFSNGTAGDSLFGRILMDGADILLAIGHSSTANGTIDANGTESLSLIVVTSPSAGSHLFTVGIKVVGHTANGFAELTAREQIAALANNGTV